MRKIISFFILGSFLLSCVMPSQGFSQIVSDVGLMPEPGVMIHTTPAFTPLMVRGMTVHPENPLKFDFIMDTGHAPDDQKTIREGSEKIIKYFLAALTIPEEKIWVNLSPYEGARVVDPDLGDTVLGNDLLAQDYILKQLSSSLMYPEGKIGKAFWDQIYQKAKEMLGAVDIPVNTFHKIWIVPQSAVVTEYKNNAFIVKSRLKVLSEKDYLAAKNEAIKDSSRVNTTPEADAITEEALLTVLIPEIEREVNEGATFAPLRQIYQAMILATWYKQRAKTSALGTVYADQNKTKGIDPEDKQLNQKIYDRYVAAYKKGVFDYIKEDNITEDAIPRHYFAGGFSIGEGDRKLSHIVDDAMLPLKGFLGESNNVFRSVGKYYRVIWEGERTGKDKPMLLERIGISVSQEEPKEEIPLIREGESVSEFIKRINQEGRPSKPFILKPAIKDTIIIYPEDTPQTAKQRWSAIVSAKAGKEKEGLIVLPADNETIDHFLERVINDKTSFAEKFKGAVMGENLVVIKWKGYCFVVTSKSTFESIKFEIELFLSDPPGLVDAAQTRSKREIPTIRGGETVQKFMERINQEGRPSKPFVLEPVFGDTIIIYPEDTPDTANQKWLAIVNTGSNKNQGLIVLPKENETIDQFLERVMSDKTHLFENFEKEFKLKNLAVVEWRGSRFVITDQSTPRSIKFEMNLLWSNVKYSVEAVVPDAEMKKTKGGVDLAKTAGTLQIKEDPNAAAFSWDDLKIEDLKLDGIYPVIISIRSTAEALPVLTTVIN